MTSFINPIGVLSPSGPGGFNTKVQLYDDFVIGGRTIMDLALASETDPFGYFIDFSANASGIWMVSADTMTTPASQAPRILTGTTGQGGVCRLGATDATSGERISMQLNGDPITANGNVYFETRVKFTNTTQDAFIGLAVTAATDPHASRPAGFVAFTLTADSDIEYATGNASTATASADTGADITAATWVTLSFLLTPNNATFYVNGQVKASTTLTLPTGLALSPVFTIESNGAAETLDVDYYLVIAERAP